MKTPAGFTEWNANLYDDKHSFVFKYGEDLVEMLKPQRGERILDLGCGTGYLTSIIAASGATVVGIDNWNSMCKLQLIFILMNNLMQSFQMLFYIGYGKKKKLLNVCTKI